MKSIHLPAQGWAKSQSDSMAWVQTFDLQPTEVCVHYWLHIDPLPYSATITLNGHAVGEAPGGQPFAVDVTDYVWLEQNSLVLQLAQAVQPGRSWLQPVPCE
ncbi:MAG: hypothetical protein H6672_21075 [Anaerolineaceae bacterium]|nr:hypothetical protein [Anaerolineaceae bacterium]